MSWTQLIVNEDPNVIALIIKQKKRLVRPPIKLDHDDPETAALPPELRQEYRYVTDSGTTEHIDQREIQQRDDTVPTDKKAEAAVKQAEANAEIVQNANRVVRAFRTQRDDIESRLHGFKTSECHGLNNK